MMEVELNGNTTGGDRQKNTSTASGHAGFAGRSDQKEPESRQRKHDLHSLYLMSDLVNDSSESAPPQGVRPSSHTGLRHRSPQPFVLPPIVLKGDGENIPSELRQLPPTQLLEIFDRKTGKILTGDDRIAVNIMPRVLMQHAEYEPIVPSGTPDSKEETTLRQGRSAPNIRVSARVLPQERDETTFRRREMVCVVSGSHEGRKGTIKDRLPGGWYVVKGIIEKNPDLTVVLPSDCLLRQSEEVFVEGLQMNGDRHPRPQCEISSESLHATFKAALEETIVKSTRAASAQKDALREEERNISKELERAERTGLPATVRRALMKRLTYVRSCLLQADMELQTLAKAGAATRVSVNSALEAAMKTS